MSLSFLALYSQCRRRRDIFTASVIDFVAARCLAYGLKTLLGLEAIIKLVLLGYLTVTSHIDCCYCPSHIYMYNQVAVDFNRSIFIDLREFSGSCVDHPSDLYISSSPSTSVVNKDDAARTINSGSGCR